MNLRSKIARTFFASGRFHSVYVRALVLAYGSVQRAMPSHLSHLTQVPAHCKHIITCRRCRQSSDVHRWPRVHERTSFEKT